MKAIQTAASIYKTEPCARSFREDLEAHLLHGFVYSESDAFVMGRYVNRAWDEEDIKNPWSNPPGELDCLMVYLAAGDVGKIFTYPHIQCKWIAFERKNVLKFYCYDTIRHRMLQGRQA